MLTEIGATLIFGSVTRNRRNLLEVQLAAERADLEDCVSRAVAGLRAVARLDDGAAPLINPHIGPRLGYTNTVGTTLRVRAPDELVGPGDEAVVVHNLDVVAQDDLFIDGLDPASCDVARDE